MSRLSFASIPGLGIVSTACGCLPSATFRETIWKSGEPSQSGITRVASCLSSDTMKEKEIDELWPRDHPGTVASWRVNEGG